MVTLAEALTARSDAEAAYAAAAAAYRAAWVERQAYDWALASRTGQHGGFGEQPRCAPHPRALAGAAETAANRHTVDDVRARAAAIIATISG